MAEQFKLLGALASDAFVQQYEKHVSLGDFVAPSCP